MQQEIETKHYKPWLEYQKNQNSHKRVICYSVQSNQMTMTYREQIHNGNLDRTGLSLPLQSTAIKQTTQLDATEDWTYKCFLVTQ